MTVRYKQCHKELIVRSDIDLESRVGKQKLSESESSEMSELSEWSE